ncbi:hypothetical protein GCM10008015_01600 [Flavobacterium palustre]|uniref:DUF3857 domain-containing protein n=1 Tax=Flavobacterium palustre TaxID=1476463 RepID=A0ABQ1H892_9FLAO|nr:DUF3857 domain-containing protein [Flavobacterium palustre]GGA64368.1 hypothetical protein GCM10008015_01600 [Flavobacterium palustre]
MKNRFLITAVLFCLVIFNSNSQDFRLGKVSIEELKEKNHPKDSSAVAAILCKKGKTYFDYDFKKGFVANHEIQIRIKIYKKEGLDWANFEVPYYVGYQNLSDEMVRFSDGITYNIENGSIVKTKLNSEGTFKENVNENWKKATIAMPAVRVGSVIELKYTIKSENLTKFPVFQIQYSVPVNHVEFCSEIPEYFIYKQLLTGYVDVKSDSKLEQTSKTFDNEYRQTSSINYQQIKSTFVADDVPQLEKESYVDNINNYRSSLQYELETTRYPNQPVKDYSQTWDGVVKTIYEDKDFGKELQERLYLLDDLKKIINSNENISDFDKINIVFKFMQSKMNWNGEYGYYTEKGVKKAYLEQTGNVAEINFNLINMLNLAGISAYPVLVSTREHGIPVFPNRAVFNYTIAAVEMNEEKILLDAVNKYTAPNILPLSVLNWKGRLVRQDGTSEEINLVPNKASKQHHNLSVAVAKNGYISGKYLVQKTDYEALIFREREANVQKENYLEKKENEFNGIEINDYTIENKGTDLSKAVVEKFTFASNNHCEMVGGKMFINPLLFFTMEKNPFVQEKRKMPIYFGYPRQEKYNFNFEIPEGYQVESIPKAMRIATDDKMLVFSVNSLFSGNNIQISVTKEINTGMASADFYDGLKEFYQKMIEKQHEKIVLKKI